MVIQGIVNGTFKIREWQNGVLMFGVLLTQSHLHNHSCQDSAITQGFISSNSALPSYAEAWLVLHNLHKELICHTMTNDDGFRNPIDQSPR